LEQKNIGIACIASWKGVGPFIHPPIPLITRVLEKFKKRENVNRVSNSLH
jgi:hypothetical protein